MYSLTVWTDPDLYVREFGAVVNVDAFSQCFVRRASGQVGAIPAELEQAFLRTSRPEFEAIRDMVNIHRLAQVRAADEEIASQTARHADALERLSNGPSKAAGHSSRMAVAKIAAARQRRERVLQGPLDHGAGRVFPNMFAPLLVEVGGRLELRPMRYRCRPDRLESKLDRLLNGAHVARRDSLEGTWRGEFGVTHGVIVAEAFFEAVALHRLEQRPLGIGQGLAAKDFVFTPQPPQPLFLACVWAHWSRPYEPDLSSFAVVVDRAPDELCALGQDWCPVPLKRENVAAWLRPDPNCLTGCYALLDDRLPVTLQGLPATPSNDAEARPARTKNKNLWRPPRTAT